MALQFLYTFLIIGGGSCLIGKVLEVDGKSINEQGAIAKANLRVFLASTIGAVLSGLWLLWGL